VAVSNRLFKDSEIIKALPCQHCNLISMGEMACYQEFCPTCGKIPPNMTKPIKKVDFLTEETKMSQPRPTKVKYPVAISNRLFKDSEIGKDLPCQHCNMIAMGEMVFYQEFCPECGRIPPNRKRQEYWFLQAINGSQKLMVAEIFYGSIVPNDFPPIVTCMSKNEQEKFRYTKKFQNVKKFVTFEEIEVPHGSEN
jgi:ribosomal protein S27AE